MEIALILFAYAERYVQYPVALQFSQKKKADFLTLNLIWPPLTL
jgi:hypothetical protein